MSSLHRYDQSQKAAEDGLASQPPWETYIFQSKIERLIYLENYNHCLCNRTPIIVVGNYQQATEPGGESHWSSGQTSQDSEAALLRDDDTAITYLQPILGIWLCGRFYINEALGKSTKTNSQAQLSGDLRVKRRRPIRTNIGGSFR